MDLLELAPPNRIQPCDNCQRIVHISINKWKKTQHLLVDLDIKVGKLHP